MAESEVKLTRLAKCAGCGAKVGAGTLSELLKGARFAFRGYEGIERSQPSGGV